VTAVRSWSFTCDECGAHATVAGDDVKEAENVLVSVLKWQALHRSHLCDRHRHE
jgi:hypothetical protein